MRIKKNRAFTKKELLALLKKLGVGFSPDLSKDELFTALMAKIPPPPDDPPPPPTEP